MNKLISLLALIALVACEDTASVNDVKDVQASNDSLATETEDIKARNDSLAKEAEEIKATLDSITGADTVATLDTISFSAITQGFIITPKACDSYYPGHEDMETNPCVGSSKVFIDVEKSLVTTTQTKGYTTIKLNLVYQQAPTDSSEVAMPYDASASLHMEMLIKIEGEVGTKETEAGKEYAAAWLPSTEFQESIPVTITFPNGGRVGESVMTMVYTNDRDNAIKRTENFKP